MAVVYLLLGSNLGNKRNNLRLARQKIVQIGKIIQESSVYESDPWGFDHPESFYNQVITIGTSHSPEQLMTLLLNIEKEMGRFRKSGNYEARIIDLDILIFDDLILNSEFITIPHPRMHLRRFVLEPLNEIAPITIHPLFNKTIRELLKDCPDKGGVEKQE
jgi:2-amino-4-hydroxy-6-hydroxymethyldihydropteridine diphosphokinase